MHDLNTFQRDLLYVIPSIEGVQKGSAIKDALDEYREGRVYDARLYDELNELIDLGFVEKNRYDGRTKAYTLTKRAKSELKARREWENQYIEDSGQ